jgi:hypothetical protein
MCVVADAELGFLLRMTSCTDGKPVRCTELTGLTVPPPGAGADLFTPELPDGVPVIHERAAPDEYPNGIGIPDVLRVAFSAVREWRARPPAGPE